MAFEVLNLSWLLDAQPSTKVTTSALPAYFGMLCNFHSFRESRKTGPGGCVSWVRRNLL
jgi:hypothetical protein